MVAGGLIPCGLFLLSARCLEPQESQDPAHCPPGRLQTLHRTLQSLPDGPGCSGWDPHSLCHRGHPRGR